MNDIQEKIGSGLNKIQDSIQTNKQKLQNVQEANQYKKVIAETAAKRSEILLQLGEELHKKLRSGEIVSDELSSKVEAILEFDRTIYRSQQAIAQLEGRHHEDHTCSSCGTALTAEDKFCGGCGAPAIFAEKKEEIPEMTCPACEEYIPETAVFCSCCGTKVG